MAGPSVAAAGSDGLVAVSPVSVRPLAGFGASGRSWLCSGTVVVVSGARVVIEPTASTDSPAPSVSASSVTASASTAPIATMVTPLRVCRLTSADRATSSSAVAETSVSRTSVSRSSVASDGVGEAPMSSTLSVTRSMSGRRSRRDGACIRFVYLLPARRTVADGVPSASCRHANPTRERSSGGDTVTR